MFDAKSDDGRCQNVQANTIAEFSKQPYSDWFEPSNWIREGEISPIPHQEQVPCRYDAVVIPQESAPKVNKKIENKILSIRFPLEAKAKIGLQSFVIVLVCTATPILLLFTWFPQRLNEFLQILDRYDSKYVFSGEARHAKFSCVLILRLYLDYLQRFAKEDLGKT